MSSITCTWKQLLIAAIAVAVGLTFVGSPLSAQTIWDGSEPDDLWFTADNWDTGVAPNGATAEAVVGAPSPTLTNGTVLLQSLNVTADGVLTVGINQDFNFATGAAVSLTNAGSITSLNNTDLQLLGMVDNSGSITIAAGLNATDLEVAVDGATLTGGGTVTLSGSNARINDASGTQILTIADQTIQGEGNIGVNGMDVINQAGNLIHANVDTGTLRLDAVNIFTNAGTLRASNGGILQLRDAGTGDFANAGGVIEALAGSEVQLSTNARIVGGVLQSVGDGVVRNLASQGAELENLTFNGSFIAENNSDTRILGTINNTGSITIAAGANATDLEIAIGGATLTGGGTVTLSGSNARINDVSGTQTLTIADQTIQGEGNIGVNTMDINNQAGNLIHANVDTGTLILDAQNIFTNAGTLRASNGGILELRDAGAGDFANTGGVIEALAGSEVQLSTNARIVGGVLQSVGDGVVRNLANQGAELENLTLSGTFIAENNTDTRILGTINNTGSITIAAGANFTDLEVAVGGATLTGGGTVILQGTSAGINDISGTQVLTIADQTIQGEGNIGRNTMDINNQAGNLIHANVDTETLILDALNIFTNAGTLRASGGGILQLRDAGAGDFANTGGVIEALAGSEVQLSTNARIVGGVLQSVGDGVVRNLVNQGAELEDLTFNGSFIAGNNTDTRITGTITNTGSITIAAGANATDLEVAAGGATLTGGGTVTLSGSNARINDVGGGVETLTIANQTIQGEGNIGVNTIDVINQAGNLIHANVAGGTLFLDAATLFTNAGTLRASGGGILRLRDAGAGDFVNTGGVIEALAGSVVQLTANARIVGGVLQSVDDGVVRNLANQDAELENLTFNGSFIAGNNTNTRITGTITNTGSITIAAGANATDLEVAIGGATLTGGGTVTLSGSNARINDVGGGVETLTIANQTIQGEGNIGVNTIDVINTAAGTILANVPLGTLTIDTASVNFANDGALRVANDSTLNVVGDLIGSATAALSGNGTIVATGGDIDHAGQISPGASPGTLVLDANLVLQSTSSLLIEIAGTTPSTDFDVLDIADAASLAGTLDIDLLGFLPSATDTFNILTASTVSGVFSNAASTVITSEGHMFDVTYTGTLVSLSNFVLAGDFDTDGDVDGFDFLEWQRGFGTDFDADDLADWEANFGTTAGSPLAASSTTTVPEPGSLALLAIGSVLLLGRRRKA